LQKKPEPVFVAVHLLAYGNSVGASEARRSVYSKKHCASELIMQPCEAPQGSRSLHRCIEAINQQIKQYLNQLINDSTNKTTNQ
jgi:hypothetical protein